MMISDNERREVAQRLRELPDNATYPDLIGAIADHDGWYAAADAADRLADLIEPDHVGDSNKMVDRDALLALADEMEADGTDCYTVSTQYVLDDYAHRIREALGVES